MANNLKSAHHCLPATLGEHCVFEPLATVYPSVEQSPILKPPNVQGKWASADGRSNWPQSPGWVGYKKGEGKYMSMMDRRKRNKWVWQTVVVVTFGWVVDLVNGDVGVCDGGVSVCLDNSDCEKED